MPPRPLMVKASGITDRGKIRTHNGDQFLIAELTKSMRVWQTSLPNRRCSPARSAHICFSWPTGSAGTGRANGRAPSPWSQSRSSRSIGSSGSLARSTPRHEGPRAVPDRAESADARILKESEGHPELNGMGTAVTMTFHLGSPLCMVHVGGGRPFVSRDGAHRRSAGPHADRRPGGRGLFGRTGSGRRLRHVITEVFGGQEPGVRAEAHAGGGGGRSFTAVFGRLTEMVTDGAIAATLDRGPNRGCREKLLAQAEMAGRRTTSR